MSKETKREPLHQVASPIIIKSPNKESIFQKIPMDIGIAAALKEIKLTAKRYGIST